MKVLELFAGSRSFSKVAEKHGFETYTTDFKPFDKIDQVCDVFDFDLESVPFVPDILWASPPCTYFSVASIGHHWNKDHTPKTENAKLGVKIVQHTWKIIQYYLEKNPDMIWIVENPRGKLRKLDLIPIKYIHTVWYCKYGDTRAKPTDLWTNINEGNIFVNQGWIPKQCHRQDKIRDCHHDIAKRGSHEGGTQGLKGNYERSVVPEKLCEELIQYIINDNYKGDDEDHPDIMKSWIS